MGAEAEPTLKEIEWSVHLGGCGEGHSFAVIEPHLHEYPAGHAPAYLSPAASPPAPPRGILATLPLLGLCIALVAVAAGLGMVALRRRQRHVGAVPEKGDPREVVVLYDLPR